VARHYPAANIRRWLWPILVAQLLWAGLAVRHGAGIAWARGKWQGLRAFRGAGRNARQMDPKVLELLMSDFERTLNRTQAAAGYDFYWRLYRLLAGVGEK